MDVQRAKMHVCAKEEDCDIVEKEVPHNEQYNSFYKQSLHQYSTVRSHFFVAS